MSPSPGGGRLPTPKCGNPRSARPGLWAFLFGLPGQRCPVVAPAPLNPASPLAGVLERIIFLNEENHYTIAEFRREDTDE